MAKVNKVKTSEKDKWEPFVTVTLSKREAAGLVCLIGASSAWIVPDHLYRLLSDMFDDDTCWCASGISIEGSSDASAFLDAKFGKGKR